MVGYLLRRLLLSLPTLFVITVMVFLVVRALPGDVVTRMLEGYAHRATEEALRKELGLDRPALLQYVEWMGRILTAGNFGRSLWTGQDILEELGRRLPVTLELAFLTILISVVLGIGIGLVSAIRQDTAVDYLGRSAAITALSVPYFALAVVVVVFPSIYFRWTPVWTYVTFSANPLENLKILLIPAAVFGITRAGPIMRITRSALLEVLRQEYVRTAWAKGLRERAVILRHALRNALIPVLTLTGLQMPLYLGGSVIMESVFRLPGIGHFFFESLNRLDYPVIQSVNLIVAGMIVFLNLVIDLSYAALDPRIRYQ